MQAPCSMIQFETNFRCSSCEAPVSYRSLGRMGELYELILYPSFSFLLIPVLQGPGSLISHCQDLGFHQWRRSTERVFEEKKIQFSGHLYNLTTIVTTCARLTRHINYSIQECGETQQLHRRTRKWTGFHLSPATPDGNPRLWWTFGFRHATSCSKSWVAGWLFPQKLIASQVFLQLYNSKEKG